MTRITTGMTSTDSVAAGTPVLPDESRRGRAFDRETVIARLAAARRRHPRRPLVRLG